MVGRAQDSENKESGVPVLSGIMLPGTNHAAHRRGHVDLARQVEQFIARSHDADRQYTKKSGYALAKPGPKTSIANTSAAARGAS